MVLASTPTEPATPHHKKRRGQHHRQTKRYAQTYWPYLPMLLIVVFGFVLNSVWEMRSNVLGYATNVSTTSLLQETNIQRTNGGYAALSLNDRLNSAAQEKANDMATRDYWSHVTPEGRQPWQFISAAGYDFTYAGENLAYGFASSADAVTGWMNSASHKANILNANYADVGFGIANATNYQGVGEQTIIVAMYGAPQKLTAVAPATASVPASSRPTPTPALVNTTTDVPPSPPVPVAPTTAAPVSNDQAAPVTTTSTKSPSITSGNELSSRNVSRFDILATGNAGWAGLTASVLITIAAISLVYRHGKMWKRYLIRGEHFIIHHPALDIVVVALVVAGVILTRTTGVIH
ncbi:MAG TPA: CAP domain-containing protein [Candidatus Saccharimonadales bacterium]